MTTAAGNCHFGGGHVCPSPSYWVVKRQIGRIRSVGSLVLALAACCYAGPHAIARQSGGSPATGRRQQRQRRSAAGGARGFQNLGNAGPAMQYRIVEGRAPLPTRPNGAPGKGRILSGFDPAALQLLQLSFKPTLPYVGIQRTQVAGSVSEQRIEGDDKGRTRLEYRTPPAFAGDIMIVGPNVFYDYHARSGSTDVAFWPVARAEKERTLVQMIRRGALTIAQTGTERLAGRGCAIITVASPRPNNADPVTQRKLWIDTQTGIVMRREAWDARGQISATYLTSLTVGLEADVRPIDFMPRSLPRSAINEPLFPKGQPQFETVEQAQARAPFHILQPAQMPEGYTRDGIWVFPNGPRGLNASVLLRYSRGVNHFSLFEHRVLDPKQPPKQFAPGRNAGSIIRWQIRDASGDVIDLIYIGHLSPEEALAVQSSVK